MNNYTFVIYSYRKIFQPLLKSLSVKQNLRSHKNTLRFYTDDYCTELLS